MRFYKVLDENGKPCNGGSGQWFLPRGKRPGKWMPKIDNLEPCLKGYHVCRRSQLVEWLGPTIWLCEIRGKRIQRKDKIVAEQARLLYQLPWNESIARLFAVDCAKKALMIYEKAYPKDKRPRIAIETAERYALGRATKEELETAHFAVCFAGYSAAHFVSYSTIHSAAYYTTHSAIKKQQTRRLMQYLHETI